MYVSLLLASNYDPRKVVSESRWVVEINHFNFEGSPSSIATI